MSRAPTTPRTARRRTARGRGRASDAPPAPVTALAGLGLAFLVLPLLALLARAPWGTLTEVLTRPAVLRALGLSLVGSLGALVCSAVLGVPLAWWLARGRVRAPRLVRALCVLPMVLPPVVGGVALLLTYGRQGPVGAAVEAVTGASVPFTLAAVVLAATFVSLPFLVVTLEAGLRAVDPALAATAATLGASRLTIARRVLLPLAAPSLRAGLAVAWARALGEFGATITFAGNLPGRTQTLPLAIFLQLDTDPAAAIAISVLLLAVSVTVLVSLRGHYLGARPQEAGR